MKIVRVLIIVFLLIAIIGCKKEQPIASFKYMDFSFSNTFESCFSIQFTSSDTVFLREHWNGYDSFYVPKRETNYYAFMKEQDKKVLSKMISNLKLKPLDTLYYDQYEDGSFYAIYIDKDSIKKLVNVHLRDPFPELDSLGGWICSWKRKATLIETNKKLNFVSAKYVLPPPPPPIGERIN